jgi:hypothetical protein
VWTRCTTRGPRQAPVHGGLAPWALLYSPEASHVGGSGARGCTARAWGGSGGGGEAIEVAHRVCWAATQRHDKEGGHKPRHAHQSLASGHSGAREPSA